MAKVDDIFDGAEGGTLTLETFKKLAEEKGAKFVDLSEGNYISVKKHNDEIEAKDGQISTLNGTLSERDKDLAALQDQLKEAGNDAEKLSTISADLSALQAKYEEDTKSYEQKLAQQARDFAIKEYAAGKKFTSTAAKRDYISNMQKSDSVKLDKTGILKGVSDFDEDYSKENADAFISDGGEETPIQTPTPDPQQNPLPMFVQQTQGEVFKGETGKESFGFSFLPKADVQTQ